MSAPSAYIESIGALEVVARYPSALVGTRDEADILERCSNVLGANVGDKVSFEWAELPDNALKLTARLKTV